MEIETELDIAAFTMSALFSQYEEPMVAANDEEYPEYENLYGIPA